MAKKTKKLLVKMVSYGHDGKTKTGTFYVTKKNPAKTEKLTARKFDPKIRQHAVFLEKKFS